MTSLVRGVLGAGLAAVAYGTVVERRWFRVRETLLDGVLAPGSAPLTIVSVADLHLSGPDARMASVVRDAVAVVDPDLVVAGGDLCGGVGSEAAVVELLRPLVAGGRPGVAVLGSNDRYAPAPKHPFIYFTAPDARLLGAPLDTPTLVDGMERDGWQVLRGGRRVVLPTSAGPVEVVGLDDPHLDDPPLPTTGEVRFEAQDVVLRLGLVHAPYTAALDLLEGAGADLVLAGHTHGGQVRIPGIGALTANCDLPLDQARGASTWGLARLHVTPGLGQSVWAPFRFGCRPEVSVLRCT